MGTQAGRADARSANPAGAGRELRPAGNGAARAIVLSQTHATMREEERSAGAGKLVAR